MKKTCEKSLEGVVVELRLGRKIAILGKRIHIEPIALVLVNAEKYRTFFELATIYQIDWLVLEEVVVDHRQVGKLGYAVVGLGEKVVVSFLNCRPRLELFGTFDGLKRCAIAAEHLEYLGVSLDGYGVLQASPVGQRRTALHYGVAEEVSGHAG